MSLMIFNDFNCLLRTDAQTINIGNTEFRLEANNFSPRPPSSHIVNANMDVFHQNVHLSRHHIVPYNLFKMFFALMVRLSNETENGLMSDVYRTILNENIIAISDAYVSQNSREIYNGVSSSLMSGGSVHVPNDAYIQSITRFTISGTDPVYFQRVNVQYRDYTNNQQLLFLTMCSWLPGNIFLGPAPDVRLDDPGEDFEIDSRPIVGIHQYELAQELNHLLRTLTFENHDIGRVNRVFTIIRNLANLPVTPFNSRNWENMEVSSRRGLITKWRIIDVNRRQRKKRNLGEQTTSITNIENMPKQNAFCDPIDLLSVIFYAEKKIDEKKKKECKEYQGFFEKLFLGSKCSKVIHDELKKKKREIDYNNLEIYSY